MIDNTKKILQISLVTLLFLFIVIYAFFTSENLIFGVKIKNVNINGAPAMTGLTFNTNILKMTGNAKNAIDLSLNGRAISIDQAGNFNETIALLLGYNIVDIRATDKFGHIDEKNYQLIYKQ